MQGDDVKLTGFLPPNRSSRHATRNHTDYGGSESRVQRAGWPESSTGCDASKGASGERTQVYGHLPATTHLLFALPGVYLVWQCCFIDTIFLSFSLSLAVSQLYSCTLRLFVYKTTSAYFIHWISQLIKWLFLLHLLGFGLILLSSRLTLPRINLSHLIGWLGVMYTRDLT